MASLTAKTTLCTLLLGLLASYSNVQAAGESVTALKTSEFDSFVGGADLSLIEFFAPWCGHCKALAPKYEKAASDLSTIDSGIKLASVDCTEEKDLCSKFDVKGYPTLKVFRKDAPTKPTDYKGGRETADIVKYMTKQNAPAFNEVNSQADVTALRNKADEVLVLGLFDSPTATDAEEFKKIANGLRNEYSFGLSTNPEVSKELADHLDTHVNTIVLVKKSEPDQTYKYDGDITQEKVNTFIQAEAFPLIGSIGPENFQKYLDRGLPLVWMFLDETKDTLSSIVDTATSVAKDFKGKFSMVKLDGVRWAEHGKHFGLKSGELPGIVIEDRAAGKNYVFPYENGSLEKSKLSTWLGSWISKTLKPTVKSAEPPASNDGPVKIIVGKEFESIVMDNEKDVLVEFFAPWCGHCKQLAPKYEELGKMFADNDNVIVGSVDATENDTPASVKGFPTLIFYPAGGKSNPLTYNGERSAEALADFIRENGKAAQSSSNASDASAQAAHDDEL